MKKIIGLTALTLLCTNVFSQGFQNAGSPAGRYCVLRTTGAPAASPNYIRATGIYEANIAPQSYLEVNTTSGYLPNPLPTLSGFNLGEVFRTSSDVNAHWRMFANNHAVGHIFTSNWTAPAPAVTGADLNIENGYQQQVSAPVARGGDIIFRTTGPQPATNGVITEKVRILGNRTLGAPANFVGPQNRSGYVGFNDPDPLFHLDMITPAFTSGGGGELYFRATTDEQTHTDIGFCNSAGGQGDVLPTIFGKTGVDPSGRSQTGPALLVLGNIDNTQDLLTMNATAWAATRYVSSRNWQYNNFNFLQLPIANLNLFSWSNQKLIDMLMNANGRLLIRNSINPTTVPGNRLEITASAAGGAGIGPADPYMSPLTPNGASGLRLTLMTSACTPMQNPGPGVLSVDKNGDVIYVPGGGGGCCIGNPCNNTPNPLTQTWEIPMTNNAGTWNYMFNEANPGSAAQVGIGHKITTCSNTIGKFEVENSTVAGPYRFAGAFTNTGSQVNVNTIGVGGQATSTLDDAKGVVGSCLGAGVNGFHAIGVHGISEQSSGAPFNWGVTGNAANGGQFSVGGHFEAGGNTLVSNSPANYGIEALAKSNNPSSQRDVGGLMAAHTGAQKSIGAAGGINTNTPGVNTSAGIQGLMPNIKIGVYGYWPNPSPTAPTMLDWAGYFDGDIMVAGVPYSSNPNWVLSDRTYKKDIKKLENVTEKIKLLNGYTYNFKYDEFPGKGFDPKMQIGFIAQELKEVFPQLVKGDKDGEYTVNYSGMIPVLLTAIKEQQAQIDAKTGANEEIQKQLDEQKKITDALQAKMQQLEQMISACCANSEGAKTGNAQTIDLSDKNIIVLNQNVPNPFAESTVITYNIPVEFSKAQIQFMTGEGKVIRTADIKEKGAGRLNVFANDLSSGMYSYSLVVDGKVIDTRKMVKSN